MENKQAVSDQYVYDHIDCLVELRKGFSFKEGNPRFLAYIWALSDQLIRVLTRWSYYGRSYCTRPQLKLLCRCIGILAPHLPCLPPSQRGAEPQSRQLNNTLCFNKGLFHMREDQNLEGQRQIADLITEICSALAVHSVKEVDIGRVRDSLNEIAEFFNPGFPECLFPRLMDVEVDSNKSPLCAICINDGSGEGHRLVGLISCKHNDFFGKSCLVKVLKNKISCPVCGCDPVIYYLKKHFVKTK